MPGLGLCLPERLSEGWLVRPRGTPIAVAATLSRHDGRAVLEVGSGPGTEAWRSPLSPRHDALLRALVAAGRDGLTAAQLSARLYGDDEHRVTVRAEVSRLRRVAGALVATTPYRIADGVALTVLD